MVDVNLLKRLMPKDSFYLILFACIGVVGASAIWVSKSNVDLAEKPQIKSKENQEQLKMIEEEIKLDLKREDVATKPKKEVKDQNKEPVKPVEESKEIKENQEAQAQAQIKKQEEAQAEQEVKIQEQAETASSESVEVNDTKLKKPVEGKIIKDFAIDKLVYSKTLDEWSTHLGIDIGAKEGSNVLAALDGIVKQVINDKQLGNTIIIDHGNSLETVYKNIGSTDLVKIGQNVKTGDIISKVSKGPGFEKLDPAHLHFEVKKSGKYVNPKNFF